VINGGLPMDDRPQSGRDRLLTPGEVAALFRVDPKTVTRWAAAGRIGSIRTPGGHRRFREAEVRALLAGESASIPEQGTSSDRLTPSP
jgi:excisionase family DNA binding protein